MKKNQFDEILTRGVAEVIDKERLLEKLQSGKKLRVKLGIDPTSPNIHIGRGVQLLKLRDFQKLGHHIVFIVGDFTGEIGDTSDKESERPMLSTEEVRKNMKTYLEQAGKLLDLSKIKVHHNSEWLEKPGYREICRQANAFSLVEIINREFIKKRLAEGKHISLREVLYPLMQGYDSVMIKSDVELGGTDQRFNMLAGRALQESYGQQPQSIITTNLILGTDGRKMSSSWGNTINFTDQPVDMYGKIMSVPDNLISSYLIHCTRVPMEEVREIERETAKGTLNPRDAKMRLAREIVTLYHGTKAAKAAEAHFISVFQKKELPDEIPMVKVKMKEWNIVDLIVESHLASSKSEARRLIAQKGIMMRLPNAESDTAIDDPALVIAKKDIEKGFILQRGKRHFVAIIT